MSYSIYKLKFTSGIHIGDSQIGQESTLQTVRSDTFFGAIYSEYMRIFGDDELKNNLELVRISDLLPYKNEDYFIPKPFVAIDRDISPVSETKIDRKKVKALQYIPISKFNQYMSFLKTRENFPDDIDDDFGKRQIMTKNQISRQEEDTQLYNIEVFNFCENAGLYFILDCPDDFAKKFDQTLESLGDTGIGAKKSIGFGKFEFEKIKDNAKTDSEFSKNFLKTTGTDIRYMVLSSYLPAKEEIASLKTKSYYKLIKCSGFVTTPSYSDIPEKRKQVYMLASGSVLGFEPIGRVADLKLHGNHSVYRLAKPIVLEVSIWAK